jgi:hemerythrin-like domain-containing protein
MVEIIEVLCQEHRNIDKLLRVLEDELNVFDRGDRPDYEVVLAAIEYFKSYPDTCHHPKEDIIYAKFKTRDPAGATVVGDLHADHREGLRRLRRVAEALERVLRDEIMPRQAVDDVIRDFISHERQHMAMEERTVFPAVLGALRPDDWVDIALEIASRYGPPAAPDFEEQFSTVRRNIIELEEAAERDRSTRGATSSVTRGLS